MLWGIFFLIMSVMLGACLSRYFPVWLPYTVGLLLVGGIMGGFAQRLELSTDCPMHALRHDRDGDHLINRTEWGEFVCEGCHANSFCMVSHVYWKLDEFRGGVRATRFPGIPSTKIASSLKPPRTCGSADQGCGWTFDDLDKPFKKTSMLAEEAYRRPSLQIPSRP